MKHLTSLQLGLLALATAAAWTACSKHQPPPSPANDLPTATVRIHIAGESSHQAFEDAVGTVRARLRAVVEAKISGRLEQMPVVVGQMVKTGDLLAQLDSGEIQARLEQAIAMQDQADADLQRFSALLQQEAVTRAEYDAVQARQRVAQAAVTAAQTTLSYARVLAPFDGVVTRKHADVGDLAAPGRPLLELEDPTRLRLEVNVPEALISRIDQGAAINVRIDTMDQSVVGTVAEIDPAADPNTRTSLVKVDLPNLPGLRAGQFGRASISLGAFAALRVPASAVVKRGQMEIAFVAHEGIARLRLVKTGKRLADEIEILSGIDSQESVIIDGVTALIDGQPILISE